VSVRARAALHDTPSSRCIRSRTDWLRHSSVAVAARLCSSVQIHFLLLQNRQGKTRLGEWRKGGMHRKCEWRNASAESDRH